MTPETLHSTRLRRNWLLGSGVPRPEVVCVCGVGGGVKPLVYRQWKLRPVTLVKWVKTTASIQTTHCHSFDKM